MFLTAVHKSSKAKNENFHEIFLTHKLELKTDTKDKYKIYRNFDIDLSVVTQNSTQLIEKMKLLDFNLISGPNDSTRNTKNSRTAIDLPFAYFPCTTKTIEHTTTDLYGVQKLQHWTHKKCEKEDFNCRNYEKLQKQEFKFEFNWFIQKKLIEIEFEDNAIGTAAASSQHWMQCNHCQEEKQNQKKLENE